MSNGRVEWLAYHNVMNFRSFRQGFIVSGMLLCSSTAMAQDLVHVVVDLYDPSHDDADTNLDDLVKVRLSRLVAKGAVSDVFYGRDLEVPIGTYRIEALLSEDESIATMDVALNRPEVRIALGASLLNYMNLPGLDVLGELFVDLEAEGEPNQYAIQVLPIWHNRNSVGTAVGPDWSAELGPLDLGDYVLVVLRGRQVLVTRHVEIHEGNPRVRIELSLKDTQQQ